MNETDRKYSARTITLPKEVAAMLEAYRYGLQQKFVFKVSYVQAITFALVKVKLNK